MPDHSSKDTSPMFELTRTKFDDLRLHRETYLKTVAAPLDGMWEDGFFPVAQHWAIQSNGAMAGYCAIDETNALIGFQVLSPEIASPAFEHCIRALGISNAFASTAEPSYLSLCLDYQTALSVAALMFEDAGRVAEPANFPSMMAFRLVEKASFDAAMDFGLRSIGDVRAWLEGYYAERIEKEELFGLWKGQVLVGAGELRISPIQAGVADIGVVVAPEVRKQGLATLILKQLRHDGRGRGFRLVCSTERENLGARKAILGAGFHAANRILKVSF